MSRCERDHAFALNKFVEIVYALPSQKAYNGQLIQRLGVDWTNPMAGHVTSY